MATLVAAPFRPSVAFAWDTFRSGINQKQDQYGTDSFPQSPIHRPLNPQMNLSDPMAAMLTMPTAQLMAPYLNALPVPLHQQYLYHTSSLQKTRNLLYRLTLKVLEREQGLLKGDITTKEKQKLQYQRSRIIKTFEMARSEAEMLEMNLMEYEQRILQGWNAQFRQSAAWGALASPGLMNGWQTMQSPPVSSGLFSPTMNWQNGWVGGGVGWNQYANFTGVNQTAMLPVVVDQQGRAMSLSLAGQTQTPTTGFVNMVAYEQMPTGYTVLWSPTQQTFSTLTPMATTFAAIPSEDPRDAPVSQSPLRAEAPPFKPVSFKQTIGHRRLLSEDVPESPFGTSFPMTPDGPNSNPREGPRYAKTAAERIEWRLAHPSTRKRLRRSKSNAAAVAAASPLSKIDPLKEQAEDVTKAEKMHVEEQKRDESRMDVDEKESNERQMEPTKMSTGRRSTGGNSTGRRLTKTVEVEAAKKRCEIEFETEVQMEMELMREDDMDIEGYLKMREEDSA